MPDTFSALFESIPTENTTRSCWSVHDDGRSKFSWADTITPPPLGTVMVSLVTVTSVFDEVVVLPVANVAPTRPMTCQPLPVLLSTPPVPAPLAGESRVIPLVPAPTSKSPVVSAVQVREAAPVPATMSPLGQDVNPVRPLVTVLLVVQVVAPVVGEHTVEPAPVTLVTPVFVQLTAPVVGEHDTPELPDTLDTAFVPVHVTAPVVGEQLTVPAPVTEVAPVFVTVYAGPPLTEMPVPAATVTAVGSAEKPHPDPV